MSLKELRDTQVDMFTTVFIGNIPDEGNRRENGDSQRIQECVKYCFLPERQKEEQ